MNITLAVKFGVRKSIMKINKITHPMCTGKKREKERDVAYLQVNVVIRCVIKPGQFAVISKEEMLTCQCVLFLFA